MRIKEILEAMASWLESPENAALVLAEYDEKCLEIVADSCVQAAFILKQAAEEVDAIEPEEPSVITEDSIQEIASLASYLDETGDPDLMKQASVIDELLLTFAAPPHLRKQIIAQNNKSEEYRTQFKNKQDSEKIAESEEAIKKSPVYNTSYEVLEAPLSTRYCPDHAGVPVARVGEQIWQCELDKKTYDFNHGFTLANGKKVPGGNVANQTPHVQVNPESVFSSRESLQGRR